MALSHASAGPDFRSLSRQPPSDPDIQATLSDFLTYTEHFPSHLTRALTLIEDQRLRSERSIKAIHNDTTSYSILPSLGDDKPDPVKLRRDISYALEEAERASSMALEEAIRLDEECAREAKRLDTVLEKLRGQPMPPSRDPTPEQQTIGSPDVKRERRMSTRVEDSRNDRQSKRMHDKAASKLRGRKIMVPGEVLPPPDPNAPLESMSDWTTPRNSPPLEEPPPVIEKKTTATPRPRSRTPKAPKSSADSQKTPKLRGPRPPGLPGTNAHSAIAGISTSNALLALTKPPENAPKGSKWLPWLKLTEWEMAKLRKRMKKNAIWVPSPTMVRRELKNLGRGLAGKEAARIRAEASGEDFLDDQNEPDPTKVLLSGEDTEQIDAMLGPQTVMEDDDDADAELINRGMRLNEAKKLKRQRFLEEQALQAQIAREQGVEMLTDVSSRKTTSASPEAQKKRKRDASPGARTMLADDNETLDTLNKSSSQLKKLKIAALPATALGTSKVPLAPAGPSSPSSTRVVASRSRRAATPPATGKSSMSLKMGHKAVSEEPPNRRESRRRSSAASMPTRNNSPNNQHSNTGTAIASASTTTRRSKRPAPGIVPSNDNESAKVGYSRRKAAPRKKGALRKDAGSATGASGGSSDAGHDQQDEYIDPDEPRYCICGDVSWGTMIACDNDDCEKEWFHLECVQLAGMPPRRTKWFCPDCRKKLKMGQASNGVVGRNVGQQAGR